MLRAIAFTVFASSLAASGQAPAPTRTFPVPNASVAADSHIGPVVIYASRPGMTGSCPVWFTAQRSGGPTRMFVDSGTHLPFSQGVLLHFSNMGPRNIEQMNVTVHGFTGSPHVMPVVMNEHDSSTRSTHAELKLVVTAHSNATTSLRVVGITSIRRIDLDSIQYDDGSEWHASTGRPCSVEPNGFMLVSAQ